MDLWNRRLIGNHETEITLVDLKELCWKFFGSLLMQLESAEKQLKSDNDYVKLYGNLDPSTSKFWQKEICEAAIYAGGEVFRRPICDYEELQQYEDPRIRKMDLFYRMVVDIMYELSGGKANLQVTEPALQKYIDSLLHHLDVLLFGTRDGTKIQLEKQYGKMVCIFENAKSTGRTPSPLTNDQNHYLVDFANNRALRFNRNKSAAYAASDFKSMQTYGDSLASNLPRHTLDFIYRKRGCTVLTNAELGAFPIELVRYKEQFLSFRHIVSRQIGFSTKDESEVYNPQSLIFIGDPSETLASDLVERDMITQVIRKSMTSKVFNIGTAQRVTISQFYDILYGGEYDIVHFTGHGGLDQRRGEPFLMLWDGTFYAGDLEHIPKRRSPMLVVLNACSTGIAEFPGNAYQETKALRETFSNVFLKLGCASFIGTLWPVRDRAAAHFASVFYRNLLIYQNDVPKSLWLARIDGSNFEDGTDILGYVHYQRPDTRVIHLTKEFKVTTDDYVL